MLTFQRLKSAVGKRMSRVAIAVRQLVSKDRPFVCPACSSRVAGFFRYGGDRNWGCPACGASPRERLVNAVLDCGALSIGEAARVLIVAPAEKSLIRRFADYDLTLGDLYPEVYRPMAVEVVDLVNFDPPKKFDLIYLSHVMEHIVDDRRALANLHNALKPGGEAWIIVPLHDGPTEDGGPGLTAKEREIRFGQWDHVRWYGLDIIGRMAEAGFDVHTVTAKSCPERIGAISALSPHDIVFVGRRTQGFQGTVVPTIRSSG